MNIVATKLSFSAALALLKDGRRVSREGWNGTRRPMFFQPPSREPHIAFGLVWIRLDTGDVAVCDESDYDIVAAHTWHSMRGYPGYTDNVTTPRRSVKLHQLLLPDAEMVDHINGDPLDNRRVNLRACSAVQNVANQRSREGTSHFKGVSWDSSREKWIASIQQSGRTKHLGRFDDETDAARAYDAAAWQAHGEFARLNFPKPRMWLVLVKPAHGAKHVDTVALVRIPIGTFPIEGANPVHVADWLGRGPDGNGLKLLPWIGMKTADDGFVPWLASQTDLLAEDWCEVTL